LDWESSGNHRPIGYYTSTLAQLASELPLRELPLRHPQHGKDKSVGTLRLARCELVVTPSFVDYLKGGCEVQLMVAIDFTGSNGDPRDPSSLHHLYNGATRKNDYQATIEKVGSILAAYDADGLIPAFGFGARFPTGEVSHCFNLNGRADPECAGIGEVLHYYEQAVRNLQLYGPTNFSEFLSMAEGLARSSDTSQANQQYFVLLIITDGVITDMQQTISTIVRASGLPLSIVIVGVGNADFAAMDVLDADDTPLQVRKPPRWPRSWASFSLL
jgi:hypothetical protein